MNIKLKLKLLERLHDQLDEHVMYVARRYRDTKNLYVDGLYPWSVEGNVIVFHGNGHSDLDIPMKFFTNTEEEFARLEQEVLKEAEARQKHQEDWERKRELAELERLQLKYMSKSGVQS